MSTKNNGLSLHNDELQACAVADFPVLEMSLADLETCALSWSAVEIASDADAFYAEARRFYLRGRLDDLASLIRGFAADRSPMHSLRWYLARLRLAIRSASEAADVVDALAPLTATAPAAWQGEAHLVCAMYHETLRDDRGAEGAYRAAFAAFTKGGSPKKAATAYLNSVAAASRLEPSRRFMHEYRKAVDLALAAGDDSVAGTALLNLSREYQMMGAILISNDLANRAVEAIGKSYFGSYQYGLALAHRSHVSAALGHVTQALKDFEEVRCSEIPELAAVARDLETVLTKLGVEMPHRALATPPEKGHVAPPTWSKRTTGALEATPLTELEDQFLSALIDGPLDRWTMLRRLYGEDAEARPLVYDNRLKQLVYRLRKKRPQLFTFRRGAFVLLDTAATVPSF